jgi:hypothetical protein
MFAARIMQAKESPPNWAGNIYDLVFSSTKKIMYSLPDGYLDTEKNINLYGFKGEDWDENINESIHMYFNEAGDERRRFPHNMSNIDDEATGLIGGSNYGWYLNAGDPRWDSIKEEYEKYCLKIHKLGQEQKAFVDGVQEVINAYSTLAPALKAWPALWDLVPEEKKEKHREVVVRTKAADTAKNLAEEVDLSKLTGHVTADKLTR